MPILNKYEIGVRNENGNIYYTGYTGLFTSRNDAITEYIERSKDDVDRKLIVANRIE